jgi:hypothetical protein
MAKVSKFVHQFTGFSEVLHSGETRTLARHEPWDALAYRSYRIDLESSRARLLNAMPIAGFDDLAVARQFHVTGWLSHRRFRRRTCGLGRRARL